MFFAASEGQLAEWVRAGLAIMQHTLKRWPTIATHKDWPMNKTAQQPKCWTNESWVESDRETWCRLCTVHFRAGMPGLELFHPDCFVPGWCFANGVQRGRSLLTFWVSDAPLWFIWLEPMKMSCKRMYDIILSTIVPAPIITINQHLRRIMRLPFLTNIVTVFRSARASWNTSVH